MKKNKSEVEPKTITFLEWYEKVGKKVYRVWEYEGGKQDRVLTPYKDIPWVTFKAVDF